LVNLANVAQLSPTKTSPSISMDISLLWKRWPGQMKHHAWRKSGNPHKADMDPIGIQRVKQVKCKRNGHDLQITHFFLNRIGSWRKRSNQRKPLQLSQLSFTCKISLVTPRPPLNWIKNCIDDFWCRGWVHHKNS
jgi:hypothetical protein